MNWSFFLQNKQYAVIFGGIFLVAVFFFTLSIFLFRSNTNTPTAPTTSVTPSTSSQSSEFFDPYNKQYKDSMKKIHEEEKAGLEQDKKVAAFINKLPELGNNFTAAYDINTNSVTVTIPSDRKAEGEKEFDAYLQANGIKERTWIQNLTIKYRDIDPFEH